MEKDFKNKNQDLIRKSRKRNGRNIRHIHDKERFSDVEEIQDVLLESKLLNDVSCRFSELSNTIKDLENF